MWVIVFCLVYFFVIVMLLICNHCMCKKKVHNEQYVIIQNPDKIEIGVAIV